MLTEIELIQVQAEPKLANPPRPSRERGGHELSGAGHVSPQDNKSLSPGKSTPPPSPLGERLGPSNLFVSTKCPETNGDRCSQRVHARFRHHLSPVVIRTSPNFTSYGNE